jgi:hypothetical protein
MTNPSDPSPWDTAVQRRKARERDRRMKRLYAEMAYLDSIDPHAGQIFDHLVSALLVALPEEQGALTAHLKRLELGKAHRRARRILARARARGVVVPR